MIDNNDYVNVIATPIAKTNTLSPIMTPIYRDDTVLRTHIIHDASNTLENDQFTTPDSSNKISCSCNDIPDNNNSDIFEIENTIDNTSICPVCLSPLCKIVVVETKCKHIFHRQCLDEAKARVAKCPLCRTELSPSATPNNFISANMRVSVIAAAQRGRNAVRLAMLRNNNANNNNTIVSNNISQ